MVNLRPINSTHYIMLYPQNGDRIVTINSVTSFHPIFAALSRTEDHIADRTLFSGEK